MSATFAPNDPRLVFHAANHTYMLGDVPLLSVTQVLAQAGLADFSAPWFDEFAKERGTFMHDAIRLDVNGELDEASLDPALAGYVTGWRAFLEATGAEVEYAEQMVCDPVQRVAGRLDYILRWSDAGRPVRTIVDLKRALYPCAAIQLQAYAEMAAPLYDGPVYFRRAALVLPGDGTFRLHPFTDSSDRATWQAALRVVHWRQAHGVIN